MKQQKHKVKTKELIDYLHLYDSSYHKYEYKDMLENIVQVISQLVAENKDVSLEKFGVFTTRKTPAKTTTDPRTSKRVFQEESHTMKFVTSPSFQTRFKQQYNENKQKENQSEPTKD